MRQKVIIVYVFQFFLLLIISNCQKSNIKPTFQFTPIINKNSVLDTLITCDLDNDGLDEYIQLTKEKGLDTTFNFYNFDNIEIYGWNKKNNYDKIFCDTVYYGLNFQLLSGNDYFTKIFSIITNTGGNDEILSKGMQLYGFRDNTVKKIFSSEIGKPTFLDIDNDNQNEILISNAAIFKIEKHEPIYYYISIFKYYNHSYLDFTLYYKSFFLNEINKNKKKYDSIKSIKRYSSNIIDPFLKICLYNQILNNNQESKLFYNSEKNTIFNFGENYFIDITRILFENGLDLEKEIDSITFDIFKKAQLFYKNKDYNNAKNYLLKILDIDPNFFDAYFLLGDIYLKNKQYDEAISYYQQASIITLDDKRLYYGLGKAYEGKQDYKTSKELYEKYIRYDSLSNVAKEIKDKLKQMEYQ